MTIEDEKVELYDAQPGVLVGLSLLGEGPTQNYDLLSTSRKSKARGRIIVRSGWCRTRNRRRKAKANKYGQHEPDDGCLYDQALV